MKWWKIRQAMKEAMEIPQWEEDYKLSALPDHHMFWEYLEVGEILGVPYSASASRNKIRFFLVHKSYTVYIYRMVFRENINQEDRIWHWCLVFLNSDKKVDNTNFDELREFWKFGQPLSSP